MDTGIHDDLISNILTWPLAASGMNYGMYSNFPFPYMKLSKCFSDPFYNAVKVGSKFQPKPKHQSRNNVSTSITSSQPPVVEELPVELPSTSLGVADCSKSSRGADKFIFPCSVICFFFNDYFYSNQNTDIVSGWDSLDDLNNKSGKMTGKAKDI